MANPILKAVHSGNNASPIERDLLPHVERRDEASIAVAKDSTAIRHTRRDLTAVQTETIEVCRQNIELTASLFDLAEELKNKKQVDIDDIQAQREIRELQDRLRTSRRKWRVIKGVASAIVAGSGVDWARDETLREIVLDPENED
ncbi:hypothetical protein Golomagni_08101 [Golovinomyces magnicellulatus]|nr:hypothetical protein Golomagni_08101 [Golovinomyces magnicellulatus]